MIRWIFCYSSKGHNAVVNIFTVEPFEAIKREINFPEGRIFFVDGVKVFNKGLEFLMESIFSGEMPIKAYLAVPFRYLSELTAHEEQFFPWMGPEKEEQQAKVCELLPDITGHLGQE